MRFYGFGVHELTTPTAPNLDLAVDPKLSWALRNREDFPVNVNTAPREMLLRIPGVGVRSVKRMLAARRWHRLRLDDLVRLRVALTRALPFIETADHAPTRLGDDALVFPQRQRDASQLDLWSTAIRSAVSGEL